MLSKKKLSVFMLSVLSVLLIFFQSPVPAMAFCNIPLVAVSPHKAEMKIGDSFYLVAFTSTGKKPTFSSSESKIASVNTYGKVTAKKSGQAIITAKIKNAEASCKVTVKPTTITLNRTSAAMENGSTLKLTASSSTDTPLKWKSNKTSIASVSETGVVTSKKPGEAVITVSADDRSATCIVTVKKPQVTLNKSKVNLYRKGTCQLSANISSGLKPKWKSSSNSVAMVDEYGKITAVKHGNALITASVDGVSITCEVVVKQPEVNLNKTSLILQTGKSAFLQASVSSGNLPEWYSSNPSVATVTEKGKVTAKQSGKAFIYASEDGVKVRCTVIVEE